MPGERGGADQINFAVLSFLKLNTRATGTSSRTLQTHAAYFTAVTT